MTTKMTERDKKLLAGLGIFCALALYAVMIFLPLYTANAAMKEQIEDNEIRIAEIEEKELNLPTVLHENETRREQLETVQQELYPRLKSQEIDRHLTEKVMSHGLSARKLQITMPEESASVIGYGRSSDDGSNPDKKDGVWIAGVSMEVAGSMQAMDSLIDDLALDTPGVRVINISWSSDRRTTDEQTGMTERYDILSLELEVLMSRKD